MAGFGNHSAEVGWLSNSWLRLDGFVNHLLRLTGKTVSRRFVFILNNRDDAGDSTHIYFYLVGLMKSPV